MKIQHSQRSEIKLKINIISNIFLTKITNVYLEDGDIVCVYECVCERERETGYWKRASSHCLTLVSQEIMVKTRKIKNLKYIHII